jgi:drug/metabolite transporter (DMT)-like permease
VIRALVPLLTLLFAILHRQESFRWRALFGSLLALGGIAIIFIDHLTPIVSLLPLLAVILGGASIAESSVIIKIFLQNNFVTTNAVGMTVGSALQFTLSLIFREPHPLPTLPATRLALAYNILVGSVIVSSLALYLLKYWPASSTSYVFVLMPFVTVLTSTLIGQDTLTPAFLTGGAVILLGVYIGALRRQKSKPVPPAEHSGFPLKAQPECE